MILSRKTDRTDESPYSPEMWDELAASLGISQRELDLIQRAFRSGGSGDRPFGVLGVRSSEELAVILFAEYLRCGCGSSPRQNVALSAPSCRDQRNQPGRAPAGSDSLRVAIFGI